MCLISFYNWLWPWLGTNNNSGFSSHILWGGHRFSQLIINFLHIPTKILSSAIFAMLAGDSSCNLLCSVRFIDFRFEWSTLIRLNAFWLLLTLISPTDFVVTNESFYRLCGCSNCTKIIGSHHSGGDWIDYFANRIFIISIFHC